MGGPAFVAAADGAAADAIAFAVAGPQVMAACVLKSVGRFMAISRMQTLLPLLGGVECDEGTE